MQRIYRTRRSRRARRHSQCPQTVTCQKWYPDNPRWFSGPRFGFSDPRSVHPPSVAHAWHPVGPCRISPTGSATTVLTNRGFWRSCPCLGWPWARWLTLAPQSRFGGTNSMAKAEAAMASQALPMNWDFPEVAWDGGSVGDWAGVITSMLRALPAPTGFRDSSAGRRPSVRTTTPRAYRNGPALLRRDRVCRPFDYFVCGIGAPCDPYFLICIGPCPLPKQGELTVIPAHHAGSREAAKAYFIQGFTDVPPCSGPPLEISPCLSSSV